MGGGKIMEIIEYAVVFLFVIANNLAWLWIVERRKKVKE